MYHTYSRRIDGIWTAGSMADARAKTANACMLHAVYRGSSIFAAVATVTHAPYCTAYLLSLLQYLLLGGEREREM
jgi:hypothetical protein